MTYLDTLAWQYLGQTLTDDFLGRRRSWDGVVIQDLHRTDQWRGHYFRVTNSWRTRPDQWAIRYEGEAEDYYLGTEMPTGEPVYRCTGQTWDMPAIPATVVPGPGTWIFWAVVWALWTLAVILSDEEGGVAVVGWAVVSVPFVLGPFWKWFYTVEPVRGTKVFVVWQVIHILWQAKLRHDQAEYAAYCKADGERFARAIGNQDGSYFG